MSTLFKNTLLASLLCASAFSASYAMDDEEGASADKGSSAAAAEEVQVAPISEEEKSATTFYYETVPNTRDRTLRNDLRKAYAEQDWGKIIAIEQDLVSKAAAAAEEARVAEEAERVAAFAAEQQKTDAEQSSSSAAKEAGHTLENEDESFN